MTWEQDGNLSFARVGRFTLEAHPADGRFWWRIAVQVGESMLTIETSNGNPAESLEAAKIKAYLALRAIVLEAAIRLPLVRIGREPEPVHLMRDGRGVCAFWSPDGRSPMTGDITLVTCRACLAISEGLAVVHLLLGGHAVCGLGMPDKWPVGDTWAREVAQVTCPGCQRAAKAMVGA